MNPKILGPLSGVVLIAAFLLAETVQAITLIPPSLEFNVDPGETISTKVKLFNETSDVVTQYASTANFGAKDETGTPDFASESDQTDLALWIKILENGPFTLQPGERLEIPVKIVIPADAEPGGHFAGIFFSSQPPETRKAGQVAISSKIGSLVLVRVSGEINESGTIVEFGGVNSQKVFNRLPVDLILRMRNDGNVHFRPAGTVTVVNMVGGTSSVLTVNPSEGAVLPLSTRRFEVSWEKNPNSVGSGSFFREFGREWTNFGFGPYTAHMQLTYGLSNDKSANEVFRFWILPWRAIFVSFLVIVFIVWLMKRYNRLILSRAMQKKRKSRGPGG